VVALATGRPTGRPPQPVEQKRRRGNPGKRPLPEPTVVIPASAPPDPPADLGPHGQSYWEAIGRAAAWIAYAIDYPTLHMACLVLDETHAMRTLIAEKGLTHLEPIVTPAGRVVGAKLVPNPMIRELRVAETQLRTHLSTLGLDPTARARLGYAEVRRQTEIEALMQQRAERRRTIDAGSG
jgi:phage terminase small subunit